jgi:hypothetical protein
MPTAQAHYYRVYQALGVFAPPALQFKLEIPLRPNIRVNIGREPSHQYVAIRYKDPHYMIPAGPDQYDEWLPLETEQFREPGTPLPENAPIFTEIHCWIDFRISTKLAASLRNKDRTAQEQLTTLASHQTNDLESAADLGAGMIALRLHRQYVARLVTDIHYTTAVGHAIGHHQRQSEALDPITPKLSDLNVVQLDFKMRYFAQQVSWKRNATLLKWLLRAWEETDDINRFISLFLPLELLVADESPDDSSVKSTGPTSSELRGKLKQLINRNAGAEKQQLLDYLASLELKRPALLSRFEAYARRIALPTAEADITAFKRFNDMRNDLFHGRGLDAFTKKNAQNQSPSPTINVTAETQEQLTKALRELIDLTERYICQSVFGDTNLYESYARRKGIV